MESFETLAAALLEQGLAIRFQASGESMRPFILNGDSLEIQPAQRSRLKPGDIVLYQLPSGRLLAHRVARAAGQKLLIQGDALLSPDGWIERAQVLGTASAVYRAGRRISLISPWFVLSGRLWLLLTPLRRRLQPGLQRLWHRLRRRS